MTVIRTYKITEEFLEDVDRILILQMTGNRNYLIGQQEGDEEKKLYTLGVYDDDVDRYEIIITADEAEIEEKISKYIALNSQAVYVSYRLGWNMDDFIRMKISAVIKFKFK